MDKVIVKRFQYVSDWFQMDDIEIDLDKFSYFYFESRGGSIGDWYLCHYQKNPETERVEHTYSYDFNLANPAEALSVLENKVRGFRCLHGTHGFVNRVAGLMSRSATDSMSGGMCNG